MRTLSISFMMCCLVAFSAPVYAITIGQLDDFQGGTVMGWSEGGGSPNPPFVNFNGGPGGIGDHSLQNVSAGGGGPGSSVVMFNQAQWTGDYTSAGVNKITGLMKASPGGSSLLMRIAIEGAASQWYASTNAVPLPNNGLWHSVSFGLTAADLTLVGGTQPLAGVLGNVTTLRILSSTGPNWRGSKIPATFDVDNVLAVPEPTSAALLAASLVALLVYSWRRRK